MKTVFTDVSHIAHLWANQTQDEARNSGRNFYFHNESIFSYGSHFCIGKHIKVKGENITLLTTRGYSNTTAKQIHVVKMASNHKNIMYVAHPEDIVLDKGEYKKEWSHHTRNIEARIREIENNASKLSRAKKPELYIREINAHLEALQNYIKVFKVKLTPAQKKVLKTDFTTGYADYLTAKAKEIEKRDRARLKKEKAEALEEIQKFRTFEIHRTWRRYNNVDLLRYNSEKKRIETSQGVDIPEEIAKRFYFNAKEVLKNGGCEDCNAKLMQWDVTSINAKNIKIGCHTIEWSEVNAIAKLLNW